MSDERLEELISYNEICSKVAEVDAAVSSIGLLSTIIIDGKPPVFSLVMCAVSGVLLSFNTINMYNLERIKHKTLIKKKR